MYAEVVAVVQDAYTLLKFIVVICAPGLICGVLYQFPFRNRDTSLWVFLPVALVLGFVGFGLREFYLAQNLGPRLLCGTCVLTDLLAWEASFVVSMGVGACSYRRSSSYVALGRGTKRSLAPLPPRT